ncbi:hypothetical protein QLQ12_34820 [Actinoplanes sp. NEAU-A12]|uniref:Uncharacterized protein n=1 Tax=Actinoplanes sandaracinus TaxID=3045177 RepID=A0ABT6WVP8_9ACTN|nr:hypothetical protein [Actinoplanes sandaracinus]MDI6103800.1 hypothetical protein [Actinoplanes sandaracinus]
MYILLVLMAWAWPLIAVVAAAFVVWWLVRVGGGQDGQGTSGPLSRRGWLLSAGTASADAAFYGYGLAQTTSLSMTDAVARCAIVRPDLHGVDGPAHVGGSESLWPLHDTTCGPELVPAFVNPLVAGLAVLCVAFTALTSWAKISRAARASAGHILGPTAWASGSFV